MSNVNPIGIIAGSGQFPVLVAQGASAAGVPVVVIALKGLADPALARWARSIHWTGVARLGSWIRIFRRYRVQRAIMAGSVKKSEMYGRFRLLTYIPDLTSLRVWFLHTRDKRNDSVLGAVAQEMARRGVILESCVKYCPELMAPEGVLTRQQPSASQWKDIEFGWSIAKAMGHLDVGQSIAVKETEVIAVEAIEGTDRMIQRAGELCPRGGWLLIKAAKPNQDMRFDVPTVGPETVENLHRAGGKVLVIEAGQSVMIDRDHMVEMADGHGIAIVGHRA